MLSWVTQFKEKGAILAKKSSTIASSATSYVKTVTKDFLKPPNLPTKKSDLLSVAAECHPPWLQTDHPANPAIFKLSENPENFLQEPPSSELFDFSLESYIALAKVSMECDLKLQKIRYQLVPRRISEDRFWRNYFYLVNIALESSMLYKDKSDRQSRLASTGPVSVLDMGDGGDEDLDHLSSHADVCVVTGTETTSDQKIDPSVVTSLETKSINYKSMANITETTANTTTITNQEDWELELELELDDFCPEEMNNIAMIDIDKLQNELDLEDLLPS